MLQENTLFDNRFTLKKFIGSGGFAEVWLVEDTLTGLNEALKIYAPGSGLDEDGVKMFIKELAVVHDLHHTNLLTSKSMGQYARQPYLVMPYCPHGSLVKKVKNLSENDLWEILRQVSAGLAYLHAHGIVHQDIKPANILIDSGENYVITDFGISMKAQSTLRKSMPATSQKGTINYMAPERFFSDPVLGPENDMWSLGATLYELAEGDVPFNSPIGSLAQSNGVRIPEMKANISIKLKQTIVQLLSLNPSDRPTAASLVRAHSFTPSAPTQPFEVKKIDNPRREEEKKEEEQRRKTVPIPPKPKKTYKWIWWVVVIILLVVIIVLIVNANSGSSSNSYSSQPIENEYVDSSPTYTYQEGVAYGTEFDFLANRYLTRDEVASMSSYERDICKNAIYARHGRYFRRQDLHDYFMSTGWYRPTRNDIPASEFNAYECANIQLFTQF